MSDPRDESGYSASDLVSMGFIATPKLATLLTDTKPVTAIDVGCFDAIVVAGGQAPMFTFERAIALHRKFVEFFEAGKIARALCHGVAVLRYARLSPEWRRLTCWCSLSESDGVVDGPPHGLLSTQLVGENAATCVGRTPIRVSGKRRLHR